MRQIDADILEAGCSSFAIHRSSALFIGQALGTHDLLSEVILVVRAGPTALHELCMRHATANARWKEPMRGLLILVACCALVSACSPSVFPYKALDGVNQDFDFAGWQLLQEPHPQQKVQLGGRIVQAEMKDDMVTITATQLSIPKNPMSRRRTNQVGEFLCPV